MSQGTEIYLLETDSIKKALLQEIEKAVNDGFTVFLSGFADGVDQYFAEIVLELQKENADLKLIAALPYRPSVYSHRNRYMDEHSDRVIAVYDGREKGGTVKTIRFAHQFRKELREIPVGLNLDKNRTNLGRNRI